MSECIAAIYQSISSVSWTVDSEGGGTCAYCSTNAGHLTDGAECSATADSSSSGAIAIGGSPNINDQVWVANGSDYNSGIQPVFWVNYGSIPSSLVVITYATSGGQEGFLNSSTTPGTSAIRYDAGSFPEYSCSYTQNQEDTTPFLSSTHYNDVYILACGNIPNDGTGAWIGPELMVGSSTSFSYAVYVFNPDATHTFNVNS